jgi:hypothetical protein
MMPSSSGISPDEARAGLARTPAGSRPERDESNGTEGGLVGTSRGPRNPILILWNLVQGDPVFMRRVNGWLTLFWIAMIPVSLLLGWVQSVVYVSALSLWALVSGHWSAWQAARIEAAQAVERAHRIHNDVKVAPGVGRETRIRPARALRRRRRGSVAALRRPRSGRPRSGGERAFTFGVK